MYKQEIMEYAEKHGKHAAADLLLLAGADGYKGGYTEYKELMETLNKEWREDNALFYAEQCGIPEYTVKGNNMIYYSSFPLEKATYRCIVDLNTMNEHREQMSKYYKPDAKIGGTQVNYRV